MRLEQTTRPSFYKNNVSGFRTEHSVIIVSPTNVPDASDCPDDDSEQKESQSSNEETEELFVE